MTTIPAIDYVAGDSLPIDFVVRTAAGVAVDLTGATIKWGIAAKTLTANNVFAAPLLVKDNDAEGGVTITDAEEGQLTVMVDRGDFVGVGVFVHELEVTLAVGESYTVASGVLRSKPAIFAE